LAEGGGVKEVIVKLIGERSLAGLPARLFAAIALAVAFIEIFYVLQFGRTIHEVFRLAGVSLPKFYDFPYFLSQLYPSTAIIIGLILAAAFFLFPVSRARGPYDRVPAYDFVLAALALAAATYPVAIYILQGAEPYLQEITLFDLAAVTFFMVIVAEATRRALGKILPAIMLVFVVYGFIFAYLNPPFGVEGLQVFRRLVNSLISQNQGLMGIPVTVMVTYVFIFLFFSSFLDRLGVGRYITDLMMAIFGRRPGGPAKVAVVSSALMGTISGSSVANTLTTGTFTIPAMKRAGFPPHVAGAIEPVASTGGQLMPPIMGAAAFIMAEFVGVPYGTIVVAALLPAILYFYSIYVFVDKEAKKRGLTGLSPEELPDLRSLAKRIYLILPIPLILVALLALEPQQAVMAGLVAAVIGAVIDSRAPPALKWGLVALLVATILAPLAVYTLSPLSTVTTLTAIGNSLFLAGGISVPLIYVVGRLRGEFRHLSDAVWGAVVSTLRNSVPVFLAAATASVIQSMIDFTKLSVVLSNVLLALSLGLLPLLLVFTGLFSIILGMGVPTTANYIITATILAPTVALYLKENLGYDEFSATLSSHMFVFYYGIIADITPPVALAAFVGAVLAGADFWKTAINATIFGFAKYILPFIFVFSPTILIVTVDSWDLEALVRLAYTVGAVLVIIHAASTGFVGWASGRIEDRRLRALLVALAIAAVTLHPVAVAAALAGLVAAHLVSRRAPAA
jgi:TRAP transporter 4TM/12TM fusion protein